MRKLMFAAAIATATGLAAFVPSSSAGVSSAFGSLEGSAPVVDNSLVTKVHGWHCSRKFTHNKGWHRHKKACRQYRHRPYVYGPSYYGMPFFGFYFDNGRRHHRHHWRHRWDD